MYDRKKAVEKFINRVLQRIKIIFLAHGKDPDACINQERTEHIQYPVEPVYQRNAHRNKNNPEQDGHQYSDQQRTRYVVCPDIKEGEDEDKDKNIIDTQAPFHE